MSKRKSAFDALPKNRNRGEKSGQAVTTSKSQRTLCALQSIKNGASISSIADAEVQQSLITEHFNELSEDAKFGALFLNDENLQKLALLEFAKQQLFLILTGRKILDLYQPSSLLAAINHPEAKTQNTFMSFFANANAEHSKWDVFKNEDLSRFLTHDHTQVRKIVAQKLDLKFITPEMIDRGLSDSSSQVQAIWVARKDEFEHNKLTTMFLPSNQSVPDIPPAL